ncbi:MAG: cell division protein FtsK [Bacteroidetes bacterium]|nr:MAG: cell division protein FtsK [Bacteroidota bacterium]
MRTIFSSSTNKSKPARNVRKGSNSKDSSNKTSKSFQKKSNLKTEHPRVTFLEYWEDERVRSTVGLLTLGTAAFLMLSSVSAIFTGVYDILLVQTEASTLPAHNIGGKLGALVGHYLVRGTFGFGFLAVPFILTILGWKALTGRTILPIWKSISWSLLAMIILPWITAFLFHEAIDESLEINLFVGDHIVGLGSVYLLKLTLMYFGNFGTGVIIAVISFITLYQFAPKWYENIKSDKIRSLFNWTSFFSKQIEDEGTDENKGSFSDESSREKPETQPRNTFINPNSKLDDIVDDLLSDSKEENIEDDKPSEPQNNTTELPELSVKKNVDEPEITLEIKETEQEDLLSKGEVNELTREFGLYDPSLELGSFKMPGLEHLVNHGDGKNMVSDEELSINKDRILATLANFKIAVDKISAEVGPTVTLYEIIPAPGIRISKIKNLEDDIALSLAALGIRIIAPIPGRGTIGIEVPNSKPDIVSMRTLIASEKFQNCDYELPIALGKTISNETHIFDLAKMPHLLMAGATGQGKSVGLNAMLVSLLYRKHPSALKFVLVDPKKVELSVYNHISRHYLAQLPNSEDAIITDTDKVVATLNSLCKEMDQRYDLLKDAQCRNLKEYNQKFINRKIIPESSKDLHPERGHHFLPYIVLVVDEFADLIMTAGKEVETPIARLAQLARAIGIHLIIATQRPSVNIITGTIKANFPARVAFRVTSKIDSRTILDAGGADQLIGRGDMLMSTGNDLIRLQCGFVDTPEVEAICNHIGGQRGFPEVFELPEFTVEGVAERGATSVDERDVLFEEAAHIIVMHQQGSTSLLQRKLKLGYNRAGRLVDQLEDAGIIGPFEGSKARKVLIPDEVSLEQLLRRPFDGEV